MTDRSRIRRFEKCILPHLGAAYNLARWLTRSSHDAEDVVQEACLRAFKFFDSFHGGNTRAWLLTIVRNTCYTWLKKNRPTGTVQGFDEETYSAGGNGWAQEISTRSAIDPETEMVQNCDVTQLNQAIAQLPLEFREVLILRISEDLSYKEIASIAHIPLGTVMSRLSRARKLLQQSLVFPEAAREPKNEL